MSRKEKSFAWGTEMKVFYVLSVLTLVLLTLNVAQAQGKLVPNLATDFGSGIIDINDLTLEQKIAQMIITHGSSWNVDALKKLQVGGLHMFHKANSQLYTDIIGDYQRGMDIPFFITADLEGCINPFANFKAFPSAAFIQTPEAAYEKGLSEGKFLVGLGFNVNFAPVVDLEDTIWRCRSFPGTKEEQVELATAYSRGLRDAGILSTAKHYPGKTLEISDPHQNLVSAEISAEDLYPYSQITNEVDMIMVSHIIVEGELSSGGVPSTVSPEIIDSIKKDFPGLIVSDEINMLGLLDFYGGDLDKLYVDLVLAGHDMILNFNDDPNEIYRMIFTIADAVEQGIISEEQIDISVAKILKAKGLQVAYS